MNLNKNTADKIVETLEPIVPYLDIASGGIPLGSIIVNGIKPFGIYNKNLTKAIEYLIKVVEKYEEDGVMTLNDIFSDEFKSYFIMLYDGLKTNHQNEKLDLFKKLIDNFHLQNEEYDVKVLYLDLVRDLSLTHIHILSIISNTEKEKISGELSYSDLYSNLNIESINITLEQFKYFLKDLKNKGLIEISNEIRSEVLTKASITLISEDSKYEDLPLLATNSFSTEFIEYLQKK